MNQINNYELQKIQRDIKDIHKAIKISASPFRLAYSSKNFKFFFVIAGVFSVLLPLIYHVLLLIYNSHNLIPDNIVIIFYSLIVICWLSLVVMKTVISVKALKQLGYSHSIFEIIRKLLSTKMWSYVFPLIVFLLVIPVKFTSILISSDLIPYLGVAIGLILNIIGVNINEKEYSVAGCWMFFSGLLTFLFATAPMHIAFTIIFSPACFLFALLAYRSKRKKMKRYD